MIDNISKLSNEELVKIAGSRVVGTPSGLDAQCAQAELTKRLTESIKQLEKSNNQYSDRILELTILLFLFGLIQVIISIKTIVDTNLQWLFGAVVFFLFVYWLIYKFRK